MNRKLLKKFATTTHAQLLVVVRDAMSNLLMSHATKLPTDQATQLADLRVRVQNVGATPAAEQITYTLFNQIVFLQFMEKQDWLTELAPTIQLDQLWSNPATYRTALATAQTVLPEIFTPPIMVAEFSALVDQTFWVQALELASNGLALLPDTAFTHVEVLGWLYQYYNSEDKTRLIKRKKPYAKLEMPIVTQIFTPEFIVKYLVDNSLGRLLVEKNFLPADAALNFLVGKYDASAKNAQPTIDELKQIKFFDPCCGSGHILLYAFELFYQAYTQLGADPVAIPTTILQNNLYGLDVDAFAVQIATAALYFTVRRYDQNFFRRRIDSAAEPTSSSLNVLAVPESDALGRAALSDLGGEALQEALELFDLFDNAKELGALLVPPAKTFAALTEVLSTRPKLAPHFQPLLQAASVLNSTYDVVVTNPPYINMSLMNPYLKRYVAKHFAKTSRDLFACLLARAEDFTSAGGYFAVMTPQVWLTAASFVKLRQHLLAEDRFVTLLTLAPGTFFGEAVVDVSACVLQKTAPTNQPTIFIKLQEKGDLATAEREFVNARLDFILLSHARTKPSTLPIARIFYPEPQQIFASLPNSIIAFAAQQKLLQILQQAPPLAEYADTRQGIITGDNGKFLRYWFEVDPASLAVSPQRSTTSRANSSSAAKTPTWFPHNKGGDYCKWYGNREYVINWSENGRVIKNHKSDGRRLSRMQNLDYNFRPAVSWSAVTSGDFSARYYDETFTFNVAGPSSFASPSLQNYLLGLLNSCVAAEFIHLLNPTMNCNVGDVAKIPFILDEARHAEIDQLVERNIELAKKAYDESELSPDFVAHPLLVGEPPLLLGTAYANWRRICEDRFRELQQNEERLNKIFLEIYGLVKVLSPKVPATKISLPLPNPSATAKSFLSYFVGQTLNQIPRQPNATPVMFTSDQTAVRELAHFLTVKCGAEQLTDNLTFLTDALGRPTATGATEFLQNYLRDTFFADHLQLYHVRPVYWQIDSGPQHVIRGLFAAHNFTVNALMDQLTAKIASIQADLLNTLGQLEQQKQQAARPTERQRLENLQGSTINQLRELHEFHQRVMTLSKQEITFDFDLPITENYRQLAPILTKLSPSRYFQKKQALLAGPAH